MGGAWSCCLPCASGGGGGGGAAVSGATPEAKKGSTGHKCQQQQQQHQQHQQQSQQLLPHHQQKQQERDQQQQQQLRKVSVVQANELAPLSNLDEELDDLEDEEKGAEHRAEEEDFAKEGGTQHRLSPRLHDIEEEDDEDGRNTKERSVNCGFFAVFVERLFLSRVSCLGAFARRPWSRVSCLRAFVRRPWSRVSCFDD